MSPSISPYANLSNLSDLSFGAVQHSSWLIQTELLSRGVSLTRLPKSTIVATPKTAGSIVAFVGAESLGTSFAGESFSHSMSILRTLFSRHEIPITQGVILPTNYPNTAVRHAKRIGLPVLIRPATGPVHRRTLSLAEQEGGIGPALDLVQHHAASRRVNRRRRHAALIEQSSAHPLLRCLVIDDHFVAGILYPTYEASIHYPAHPLVTLPSVPRPVASLAVRALKAVPGVRHAEVDMIVSVDSNEVIVDASAVVDVRCAVNLQPYETHRGTLGGGATATLVEHYAQIAKMPLSPRQLDLSVELSIEGMTDPAPTMVAIEEMLQSHPSNGTTYGVQTYTSSLVMSINSSAQLVAALTSSVMHPDFSSTQTPDSIRVEVS